ncbi:membrane protein insertase YidC [Wenxinia marina]|uniref:Membrane protein insertase YidC n=1 Tax=Wenxinia marina DSM 24838 TaxID=1123501 RepID=A0A0D0NRA6_9RHOB|nr:membrane protein insertase YidC [Wenxinia marina]KIQ70725.1 protein translocase subunit yidC [Wenxinia marina DSM 24838]GGL51074.1 membrane protein insertase YidC [Wenxinia marina]
MDDQNKNLILATALSFLVILTWFLLFPPEEQAPGTTGPEGELVEDLAPNDGTIGPDGTMTPGAEVAGGAEGQDSPQTEVAVAEAPRIDIESGALTGSISLEGGRIDDLSLADYRQTLDPESDLVRLLSPVGGELPYYALHGWIGGEGTGEVPGPNTVWEVESGETLGPDSPVTLVWENGAGLTFRKTFAVDERYMFTVTQSVENATDAELSLRPYGLVARHGLPDSNAFFILHEGVVRMSDGELEEIDYDDLEDFAVEEGRTEVAADGWIGFTDKYWMTTLIPEPGTPFRSVARYGNGVYQTEAIQPALTVAPGATAEASSMLFAGAKEWEAIHAYEEGGVQGFVDSIDWGLFFFLTKPIFRVLHFLNGLIGNMGWSIIVLTLLIKTVLFPLARKSYISMARMKELQPEMEKLKEQAGDDRQKLQQGMMELYRKNKVNPASGCLPILLQIPIFFSLYKVIFVTIELRHAPWIGWIRDLSAPDPSSILNLFGLLPYGTPDPSSFFFIFSLGVLPILLGISMWLQQKLNPAPPDPTQRMIFAWMPWVFMFMLGSFASGLVIYWIANNTITFLQQYTIMRLHGHKPDVFGNIRSGFRRSEPATANADKAPKKGK